MNELTRAELMDKICPTNAVYDCGHCSADCDKCAVGLNYLLDRYDAKIRADAEREFQNSDYWNDYLAKVIADAKAEAIDEVNKSEDTLIKCFKKENDIWTIRMAFAELREQLKKGNE